MNTYDIELAKQQYASHPVLSKATRFLADYQFEVNQHSDGWAYWKAPYNAAKKLMHLIQHPETATEERFTKSLAPIKSFYTRKGNAAGMKYPSLDTQPVLCGLDRYPEFKPLVDRVVALAIDRINREARKIESEMPYKAQFTLEEVIKKLESCV